MIRTGDVIERVFDPTVPEQLISRDELQRVSWSRDGSRIEALLREVPVGNVRAPIVAALLTYIGLETLAPLLRALAVDLRVPPVTRGIAVYFLHRHRISPRISLEQLPELASSLLIGTSLLGSVETFGPILAHWLTRPGVDGERLFDTIEPWRIAAAAHDDAVYGPALAMPVLLRWHPAIRRRCASAAPVGGSLWSHDRTVWALFAGGFGFLAAVCVQPGEPVEVSPLLDRARADEFARRLEGRARAATLDTLSHSFEAHPEAGGDVHRARWLVARARAVSAPSAEAAGDRRSEAP